MQKEIQRMCCRVIWIRPTVLKRCEVDKVTQAGLIMLRVVKGSKIRPQLSTEPFGRLK